MKVGLSFNVGNQSFYATIDETHPITIGSGLYDSLQVKYFKEKQFVLETYNNNVYFSGKDPYKLDHYLMPMNKLVPLSKQNRMFLYVTDHLGPSNTKASLPFNGEVTIGRSQNNMIVTSFDFMSREHMKLVCREGIVTLKNLSQSNGTFVNGVLTNEKVLKSGDVINVFTFRITYYDGQLRFENCADLVKVSDKLLPKGKVAEASMDVGVKYHRSPRIQSQLPTEPILLDTPPAPPHEYKNSRSLLMSLLGPGTMIASSMMMGAASPAFMAARALSLVMPMANIAMQKKNEKKAKEQVAEYERLRKETYGKYIEGQVLRIRNTANEQRRIIKEENPSVDECITTVLNKKSNLWERTHRDRDFLDVRLGMGYEKLCVDIKGGYNEQSFQMEVEELREIANAIKEENEYVDDVPSRLKLREYNTIGLIGKRTDTMNQMRNMIIALSSLHFYKDVKIVGIFDESEKSFWEPIRWLPHVFDDDGQSRFLAFNMKEADLLCDRMNDMLEQRKRALKDNQSKQIAPLPHYIFIVGSKRYVKGKPMLQNLLLNRKELGVSSIFMFDEMYELPQECQFIIEMNNVSSAHGTFSCGYERDKINHKFLFKNDANISTNVFDNYARIMSAIEVDGFEKESGIPQSVTFLEGFGVETVEELNVEANWRKVKEDESLSAPIGIMRGGKTFSLDAFENSHGPHGLLAGTTGSGKSELLQSWILSMAVKYHPHDVSFVLVDYKGGGMSGQFEGLPHLIGEITNIGEGIERSFKALEYENERRERVFEKYGVNNITKYHNLYRKGEAKEILPHLIYIVDEFAMMKKEKPDSIPRLIKIATVGRSLGIHLLLATQSPSGVVDDQIKNNSKFNLCLKVQSAADSRDLLKTSDGANIRTVGRCFIRVGNDEVYEQFQSFWSGAPYHTNGNKVAETMNRVKLVKTDGTRLQGQGNKKKIKADSDELTQVVKHIADVAEKMNIKPVDPLWKPELSGEIILKDLKQPYGFDGHKWIEPRGWLKVPIGMYDMPSTQTQGIEYLDFAAKGNLGIYGTSGAGKTNMIKTIMYSLGLHYSPNDVHIYGIDAGGGTTTVLESMPHVGGVARVNEDEKIMKLKQMITDEMARRNQIFMKHHIDSLEDYREAVAKDIPAWFIFVENVSALIEYYPDLENFLVSLSKDGRTKGIYLIVTSSSATGVRYKIKENITNNICFQMNDRGDYNDLVGRGAYHLPAITGRAFVKGMEPLLIQAALYLDGENELARSRKLLKELEAMDQVYEGPRPKRIPIMPDHIPMMSLLSSYKQSNVLPVGVAYFDMEVKHVDLSKKYNFVVCGNASSGKSRFLENMTGFIREAKPNSKIYVLDGLKRSLNECESYVDGYSICSDDTKVTEIADILVAELRVRSKAYRDAKKDPAFNEELFSAQFDLLCIVIDEVSEFVENVSDKNIAQFKSISKNAANLGVIVLVAGRIGNLEQLSEKEPIVNDWVAAQKGLVISGTAGDNKIFENCFKALSYNDKKYKLKENEAYLVDNDTFIKIKPAG